MYWLNLCSLFVFKATKQKDIREMFSKNGKKIKCAFEIKNSEQRKKYAAC